MHTADQPHRNRYRVQTQLSPVQRPSRRTGPPAREVTMMSIRPGRPRARAALSAALLLGSLLAAAVATDQASAADVGIQATTFADEFNGPAGSGVDGSKWSMETGNNGGNNHEYQWYTAGTN